MCAVACIVMGYYSTKTKNGMNCVKDRLYLCTLLYVLYANLYAMSWARVPSWDLVSEVQTCSNDSGRMYAFYVCLMCAIVTYLFVLICEMYLKLLNVNLWLNVLC